MAKRVQVELPDRVYEELARVAGSRQAMNREVVAAIKSRLAVQRRRNGVSILSIIGIGEGDPKVSQQVDQELYGPRRRR